MPYNPQVPYIPMRADLGQWGAALMEIMGQKDRKAEQAKEEAKQFKTYVAMGEQIGLNKDELLTRDLGTVRGMVEGKIAKQKFDEGAERFKQLMGERAAREAFGRSMNQAQGRNLLDTLGQGNGPVRPPALTSDQVMQAMTQNPESFNAPQSTDLLRIMQSGQDDPTRSMFAESNLLNARAKMLDAQRRNTATTTQPAATGPAALPPVPEFDPPEGYNWTFNGKAWQMTQPRGKTTGDALSEKLGVGGKVGGKPAKEVTRQTKDGRMAIFDEDTKQFLRYAN
jgi:hypothetical protein